MLYVDSLAVSDNVLFVIRKHWYCAVQYFLIAFKFTVFNSQDIIIHFAVEHYFHYALVDILDSLIEERDRAVAKEVCFSCDSLFLLFRGVFLYLIFLYK